MTIEILIIGIVILCPLAAIFIVWKNLDSNKNKKSDGKNLIIHSKVSNKKLPNDLFSSKKKDSEADKFDSVTLSLDEIKHANIAEELPTVHDIDLEELPIPHNYYLDELPILPDHILIDPQILPSIPHDFYIDEFLAPPDFVLIDPQIPSPNVLRIDQKENLKSLDQFTVDYTDSDKEFKLKTDCEYILNEFKLNNIIKLYHFTDRSNVESIISHGGIYSFEQLRYQEITVSKFASDDFSRGRDATKGLGNYVRLTFSKNHPMLWLVVKKGKVPNPILLEIDLTVALWKSTLFSDKNAVRNNVNIGEGLNDFKKIRMKVVKQIKHFNLSEEDMPYYQAEVMVKEFIPLDMITNISNFKL